MYYISEWAKPLEFLGHEFFYYGKELSTVHAFTYTFKCRKCDEIVHYYERLSGEIKLSEYQPTIQPCKAEQKVDTIIQSGCEQAL